MTTTLDQNINIELNHPAPIFIREDIFDRRIDLSAYRGKKVLLAFFRHAACPFCNVRVFRLQKQAEKLKEQGLEMIFFFESTKENLLKNSFHPKVSPIPLIADPDKVLYLQYGVPEDKFGATLKNLPAMLPKMIEAKLNGVPFGSKQGSESIYTLPAEFLIDEKGIIKKLHYAKSLTDRMAIGEIERFAVS